MKILYVDTRINGHHFKYMSSLMGITPMDSVACVPKTDIYNGLAKKIYFLEKFKDVNSYYKWMHELRLIIKNEKPELVHFLYGDDLYRYFGWGLKLVKCKTIITLHQVRRSRLRDISLKRIAKATDKVVVHTSKLKKNLNKMGIKNVIHIEYPRFNENPIVDKKIARDKLGIKTADPILLALGGTRTDKGLDLLLDALNKVSAPFYLIIAGKEEDIKKETINEKIDRYRDKATVFLEFLSEEKFANCLNAADFIILPYRRSFDGASGPLSEAVALGKCIIGANHGSLGGLIEEKHLGYTFKSECISSLAYIIDKAINGSFFVDEIYEKYRNSLNVEEFLNQYKNLYEV